MLSGSGLKNRDDHRHHAIDAAVIGITDHGLLQSFAKASASARESNLDRLVASMPLPWPNYRDHVERAVNNIIVSHKPDHGYQGAMHEETAWGLREAGEVTRKVRPAEGGVRERVFENKKVIRISSSKNIERHGLNADGEPKAYKGYVGGSNYCMEIWCDEQNKWRSDVISTFDAYRKVAQSGEVEGLRRLRDPVLSQSGKPLVMRLMNNDLVCIKLDGNLKIMRVVKMASSGVITLASHNEANTHSRNADNENSFKYLSKVAGSLRAAEARHVTVSPVGDLSDPGFKG